MLQTRLLLAWCSLYLISLCTVSGVSLQIRPQTVVLLTQSPPQTSFLCDAKSAQDIASIFFMSLSKVDQNGQEQVFATATVEAGVVFKPTAPQTLKKLTPAKVGGGIDTNTAADSTLTVDFETDEMVCEDAGMYKCSYTYIRNNNVGDTTTIQANLSVHALPSDVTLTAQKGGMNVVGTLENPLAMDKNESIQFTCNGNIGSETTNLIRWKMSSVYTTDFMSHTDNVVNGAVSSSGGCSYTSSSTMTYVVQARDADGDNYLAFKCFVTDQPPNQAQVTQESSVFYITVIGGNSGSGGNPGDSTGGGPANAGAIAGGVIGGVVAIVIIVLLVYFLWYRRRSAGDTYRTKEDTGPDNPNIAPSTDDLYAKPAKDKNRGGHDNNGVDEDYNYRDADDYRGRSRGRENRAMDNDSYNSRDGSPTMHMGSGHIGTGV